MRIHISLEYLKWFEKFVLAADDDKSDALKYLSYKLKIFFSFFPSEFYCTKEEYKDFLNEIEEEIQGTKKPSLKFQLYSILTKNLGVNISKERLETIDCPYSYYFTTSKIFDLEAIDKGVISKSKNKESYELFDAYTLLNNTPFDNVNYDHILKYLAPANCMIIADKYMMFNDIYKLMDFIKNIKGSTKDFHVTLQCSTKTFDKGKLHKELVYNTLQEKIEFLKENINDVQFQFLIKNDIESKDRFIFTNYAIITIGHPFQVLKKPTYFTQRLLAQGDSTQMIQEYYQNQKIELRAIQKTIQQAEKSPSEDLYCINPVDHFQNRIFDILSVPVKRIPIVLRDQRS